MMNVIVNNKFHFRSFRIAQCHKRYPPIAASGNPDVTKGLQIVVSGNPIIASGNPDVTKGIPIVTSGNPIVASGNPDVAKGIPVVVSETSDMKKVTSLII